MGLRRKKAVQQSRRTSSSTASRIYSRDNVARYAERSRQRRRGRIIRRTVLGVLLAFLVTAGTATAMWFNSIVARLSDAGIITPELQAVLVDSDVAREPFYMLLLGTDGRPGETSYRADTIILARIDPTQQQVTLISIPRDTCITYKGETMKINAAHTEEGAAGMVEAVNELCGIEISHYAEISFDGLVQLVDALGGVEVNVPDEIDDPKAADFTIEPGLQTLNGEQALAFCRSRAFADGDYTRMRHQRIFVAALANTILNKTDATQLPGIIDAMADMVATDLSLPDILSLANAMRGMDTDSMWTANIPSHAGGDTYINGVSYVFVHEEELEEMMARVDAGEDPEGPQSGLSLDSGSSTTIGDLSNNEANDWANGTATTSGSSSEDESAESGE
ncbi:LCP family protein [Enorma phocaeensis]|uniref:LCP family protein n=1 Tax=Enorma phocaeensis TaxID=1871019 RepID=UPI00320B067D